ncbi:IS3 family transposase [Streptomyces beigongshangae]|uniref:IS3 family transposase n=1 Tax=Streptomyces beigongshangae TaxID=2841597 RepID=UPI001C855318|nr:IS3 family transposase [Streptomyces sp. REN17]
MFRDGDALVNRCQFVDDHRRRYGVKRLCDILALARSSFYYRRRTAGAGAARQIAEARVAARMRTVHQDSDGTYGTPRITVELRDEDGPVVNHKRVARIMRTIRLEGVRLRRRHRTTFADQAAAKAPDLIGRDFTATGVNTKCVGDITYLPVSGSGPLYLATVIDLAPRRRAGWAIADHMRTELVIDAFTATEQKRDAQGTQRLVERARGQARRLPPADSVQHPPPALPPRSTISDRLRERPPTNGNYPDPSRMDVFEIRGQGPSLPSTSSGAGTGSNGSISDHSSKSSSHHRPSQPVTHPYRRRAARIARPRDLRSQRRDLPAGTGAEGQRAPP